MRGIVSELPNEIPFHISDDSGNRYRGVYAIGLWIWNKGSEAVSMSDFLPNSPLQVRVGDDATVASAYLIPIEKDTDCSVNLVDERNIEIVFDCVNPGEYLQLCIFVTGNHMTEVNIAGRIRGQSTPIDNTAGEVKANLLERLSSALVLVFVLNGFPGVLIWAFLINKNYSLQLLWSNPDALPNYYAGPIFGSFLILGMFIISQIIYWIERKKIPSGYPLRADLEPPVHQNIMGLIRTIIWAEKQRVSTSFFDWGQRVIMPGKKTKRRSVNDWVD